MSDELTQIEEDSIRTFLHSVADEGYLRGNVLDYGSGRQPYRRLVEEHGGHYTPYDSPSFPCSIASSDTTKQVLGKSFDTILCTQVLQFVEHPRAFLYELGARFPSVGHLVMTYTTNWPEVNEEDLHRYTRSGMERLLPQAGWTVLRHDRRATTVTRGYEWAFGYGVLARRS